MSTATTMRLDKALDGARILWRWFLASDSRQPNEGYVREFSPSSSRVRISETPYEAGEWMETVNLQVVEVLEDHCLQRLEREAAAAAEKARAEQAAKKKARKPKRIEGDEWKDADQGDELGLGPDA